MMRKTISSVLAVAACVAAYAGGLKFDISSDHADATYKLGEQAVFTVKALDASGAPAKSGRVKWNLNNFGAKVFASGEEDLAANGGTFTVKGAQTEPGFLRLDVTEVGKKPSSAKWGVAFEPKKIVPGTPYPDDFMDFWRSAIAKYDAGPLRVGLLLRTRRQDEGTFPAACERAGRRSVVLGLLDGRQRDVPEGERALLRPRGAEGRVAQEREVPGGAEGGGPGVCEEIPGEDRPLHAVRHRGVARGLLLLRGDPRGEPRGGLGGVASGRGSQARALHGR